LQLEVLVVDDCSSDRLTLGILEELDSREHVRVVRQPRNAGPAAARNSGIREAKGEWIGFLDSDDLLVDGALAMRLDVATRFAGVEWIAGDYSNLTAAGGRSAPTGEFPMPGQDAEQVGSGLYKLPRPTSVLLGWSQPPQVGTAMLRKEIALRAGLFDENLRYGEDWYFWLLVSREADLYWLQADTVQYRRHGSSMMNQHLRVAQGVPIVAEAALRDPRLAPYRKQLRWYAASNYRWASRLYCEQGKATRAMLAAVRAAYWSPSDPRNMRAFMAGAKAWFTGASARRP
jgi:glycosyltransferase involved in cell wall biosynthesis